MSASVIRCDDVFSFQVVEVFSWYGVLLSWVINVCSVAKMDFKDTAVATMIQLNSSLVYAPCSGLDIVRLLTHGNFRLACSSLWP